MSERARWVPVLSLGIGLTALNAFWMTYMEIVWNQGCATMLSLYYNAVFSLIVLLLLNAVLRHRAPKIALSRIELLLLFIMMTTGTAIAVLTEMLVAMLPYPAYYGHQDSCWQEALLPHLSRLMVTDPQAVKHYYLGNANLWAWSALRPWLLPFVGWGLFLLALTWTSLCLSMLVYNQWRHQEKMPFPLVQIPLMLTEPRAAFWRSWLFWLAFAIAAGIDVLDALHRVYPFLPELAVKRQMFYLPELSRPWSDLSPILYSFNPLLIGLEFFLPLDLLFSVVFFFWFGRMQGVLVSMLGAGIHWSPDNMVAPYVREQALGSLLTLLAFSFYTARGRWRESWTKYRQILSWRQASLGIAAGFIVMTAILLVAGMPAYLAVLTILLFCAVTLSLARIRAQYGPPSAGLMMGAPGPALYSLLGRDVLGAQGLTSLATTHWLGRECGYAPLASTVESQALTEGRLRTPTLWIVCILVSALVGYSASFGTALATGYHLGEGTARVAGVQYYMGSEAYNLFSARFSDTVGGPHLDSLAAMGLGVYLTCVLQALRTRFVGFPLHPVGYAIGSSYISTFLWSTCLPVWFFKLMLLRYAGRKGYHKATPFFLGLLLGEFIVGSLISLVGVALGTEVYVFWPY